MPKPSKRGTQAQAIADAVAYAKQIDSPGSHKAKLAAAVKFAQQQRLARQQSSGLKAEQRKPARQQSSVPTLPPATLAPPMPASSGAKLSAAQRGRHAANVNGIDRAMRELRGDASHEAAHEGRRRVQLVEPRGSAAAPATALLQPAEAYERSLNQRLNQADPGRVLRQREAAHEAERAARRQQAEAAAERRAPNWWPRQPKVSAVRRPPEPRMVAAAEARLLDIKMKLEGGEDLSPDELSDAAAILELRQLWAEAVEEAAKVEEAGRLPPIASRRPFRANGHEAASQMVWLG